MSELEDEEWRSMFIMARKEELLTILPAHVEVSREIGFR